MKTAIMIMAIGNPFNFYPGFVQPKSKVQAIVDKGPVLELIVACQPGEGIISYSKIDRKFCLPDATCYAKGRKAIAKLCR